MTEKRLVVLKFGSSVLRDETDLPRTVEEIRRIRNKGARVLAVVSAFGDTTDQLMRRAEVTCQQPEHSSLAMLLATGEATSSALLGLALHEAGIPVRVLDPVQAGLRTAGDILNAEPIALDCFRLLSELDRSVVVLPGFVGRNERGETTLLGRGGSDYSALFMADRLGAHCVLLKDVDGLYTSDPNCLDHPAIRFTQVNYETAIRVGGSVVQQKAVRFASLREQRFSIASIGAPTGTEVGPFPDRLVASFASAPPLRLEIGEEIKECVA